MTPPQLSALCLTLAVAPAASICLADATTPWAPLAQLDPSQDSPSFGFSTAYSGNTALVGAQLDSNENGVDTGAVYVFVRSGGGWTEQAKLVASDGAENDLFGASVDLFGDTALIGAFNNDQQRGAAYVFVRTGDSWTEEAKLVASDGDIGDFFGRSVALFGDTALVGSPWDDDNGASSGSAYVFVGAGDAWDEQQKLLPGDGGLGDQFGDAVALSGDTALITASRDDNANGTDAGSAYVFVRSADIWAEEAKLVSDDGTSEDNFGCCAAAISGETVLVGAAGDSDGAEGNTGPGSAYVFVGSGDTWSQQAKLVPSLPETPGSFGISGALQGDTAVVGDVESNGFFGRAYVFVRSGDVWTETAVLEDPDPLDIFFGQSVGLSNGQALITRFGRAYVFSQVFFSDGFEAGDTSAWSVTVP